MGFFRSLVTDVKTQRQQVTRATLGKMRHVSAVGATRDMKKVGSDCDAGYEDNGQWQPR